MNLQPAWSVHLVVTSPLFWQPKDYRTENQIGFPESYKSYINNQNLVSNECEYVNAPKPTKEQKECSAMTTEGVFAQFSGMRG